MCKRFGVDAVERVRGRLPPALTTISPVLTAKDWLPVYTQVVVTEAIVDEFLAGDLDALYPLLVADTRASLSRVHLLLARSLGAARAFKHATAAFGKVYDRGEAAIAIDNRSAVLGRAADLTEAAGRRARMTFAGHPLFEHPTWRQLQLFALRLFLELAGTPGEAVGEDAGADRFVAIATWS